MTVGHGYGLKLLTSVKIATETFLDWWLAELRSMLPPSFVRLAARTPDRIVFVDGDGGYSVVLESRELEVRHLCRIADGQELTPELGRQIMASTGRSDPMPVGLRLHVSKCLRRRVALPSAALKRAGKILELDLRTNTPFRNGGVAWSYCLEQSPQDRDRVNAVQIVVRRNLLDTAIAQIEKTGLAVAFAGIHGGTLEENEAINFLAPTVAADPSSGPARPRLWASMAAIGLLAGLAAGAVAFKQAAAIEQLNAEIARLRQSVRVVEGARRLAGEQAKNKLRLADQMDSRLRVTEIWRQITSVIPDDAWLTDLRLEGQRIEISGYAQSAATLVNALSGSSSIIDVGFMAPVVLDPREGKQQFSIAFQIRRSDDRHEKTAP